MALDLQKKDLSGLLSAEISKPGIPLSLLKAIFGKSLVNGHRIVPIEAGQT